VYQNDQLQSRCCTQHHPLERAGGPASQQSDSTALHTLYDPSTMLSRNVGHLISSQSLSRFDHVSRRCHHSTVLLCSSTTMLLFSG
jgi:hypothetical protein